MADDRMAGDRMDSEFGQLRWRCRRGMKELDLLLTRYADDEYRSAAADHQRAFRRLLELQDPLILDYFLGRESPSDPVLCSLIERITDKPSNPV
jgi:antitoxin CptB